jgi:uncharacterized protein YoxC
MSDKNVSKETQLILSEVRGVSAAVTSLTRHVDRMDERLSNGISEIKADVTIIKSAVSEISVDVDNHEQRIKRLENQAAH